MSHLWYVSYGSNMHTERLRCYIAGGCPAGATRTYPGCRNTTPPVRSRGTLLTGGIYFATHSPVWNGGRALFDPDLPGTAAARAWLVTPQQFADIAAQEMYREPGEDLDLDEVLRTGRAAMGPGRYETLLYVGDVDGYPQLTFTADHGHRDVDPVPPSAPYLAMLVGGLQEAHGWSPEATADYLASRPGIGTWNAEAILAACIDDRSAP